MADQIGALLDAHDALVGTTNNAPTASPSALVSAALINSTTLKTPASLSSVFVQDAHILAMTSHDFFAEVLPGILLVFGVFFLFALLTWIWTTLWAFFLRKCAPEHWVRFTTYVWGITIVLFGLAAAFGAVGINFGHLFIGFGLISIAFSAGFGSTIANVFSGIMLQTHGLYANHERVRLPGYNNLTGSIVSMNLLHVVVKPDAAPQSKPGSFAPQSVLVPNTVFTDSPVEVEWSENRQPAYPTKPARAAAFTASERRAYGQAKRLADAESLPSSMLPPRHQVQQAAMIANATSSSSSLGELAKRKLEEQRHRRRVVGRTSGDLEAGPIHRPSGWSFDA